MAQTPIPGLSKASGYSASRWNQKLFKEYNAAKRRNGGNSLTVYGRVSEMADILEGVMPMPADCTLDDLISGLERLMADLRRA